MMVDRYRTHKYQAPPPVPRNEGYRISLPWSYFKKVRAEMIREQQQVTVARPQDISRRRNDDPVLRDQIAVLPPDERDAKYGKALVYADLRPGMMPVIAVSGGKDYWQDLKDIVDETRHYGQDAIPQHDTPDLTSEWAAAADKATRKRQGKTTYGSQTKGLI